MSNGCAHPIGSENVDRLSRSVANQQHLESQCDAQTQLSESRLR